MIVYNLEYSLLDKLGRAKSTKHVGLFKSENDVTLAKARVSKENSDNKISFQVYIIDDPFLKVY